jgi:hypothetical protein
LRRLDLLVADRGVSVSSALLGGIDMMSVLAIFVSLFCLAKRKFLKPVRPYQVVFVR